ncbi:MAG: hypothetical protein CBC09_05615 [Cellvibrionales bacterium TMED49]|nr:hypothetical protein [Porticoccaceae bacterium]OUU38466.1 MAG: hypothetical protein CBC09_05615 [Cellvibrionales bacterium TMED49]
MHKFYLLFVLLAINLKVNAFPMSENAVTQFKPESVGMSSIELEKLDHVIVKRVENGDLPGAVVAISRKGQRVFVSSRGLMDPQNEIPMRPDAMFVMQSSSKPVLGVAAMIAMERGLFDVQDEIYKYIPRFKDIQVAVLKGSNDSPNYVWATQNNKPNYFWRVFGMVMGWFSDEMPYMYVPESSTVHAERPVTIHDLLTHTAGVGAMGLGQAVSEWGELQWDKTGWVESGHTLQSYIDMVASGPLDFQPGSRWGYSIGLDVVARIIEITSGQPYNEFVHEHIFEPLDMRDTYWYNSIPPEKRSRVVALPDPDNPDANLLEKAQQSQYYSASIGLVSTANDFLNFEQMRASRGFFKGRRVLAESSVDLMATDHEGDLYTAMGKTKVRAGAEGMGYTVWVILQPDLAFLPLSEGSSGWGGAFGTLSWSEPDRDLAVVIMSHGSAEGFSKEIAEIINTAIVSR